MIFRHLAAATAVAVTVAASPAGAAVSTFAGSSFNDCDPPPAPTFGTSTGVGSCSVSAFSTLCVTGVDANEVAVASPCAVELDGTTSLFYVQARTQQNGPVAAHCFGTGSGTLTYRPTPSSPSHPIPVTISVEDQTASFSGAAIVGVRLVVVDGTYTSACGGGGVFAGEAL